MYFKVNNIQKKDVLHSTNESLEERWSVVTPQRLTEVLGQNFTWAKYLDSESRMYERTRPYPGYDSVVGRAVMIKVLKYTEDEVLNPQMVMNKRKVLEEQIHMLNTLATPLLPEPLDWFQVSNTVDGFTDKEIAETEPVLVLDYIPGETLSSAYKKNQFKRFEVEENANGGKEYKENGINVTKICMFISRNIDFLRVLNDKGYMFLGLSPEHILVLKNEIPRFLGLGRICKTKDGKFDAEHINFGRMIRGYSAPELNQVETNFGQDANALAAGVYSVGVILAQMIYGDFEVYDDTLSCGSIAYPNDRYRETILKSVPQKGRALDNLITRLCDPDPNKRLTDLDEIDSILRDIGGIALNEERSKMDVNKNKKSNNISQQNECFIPQTKQTTIAEGVVEKFDKKECTGVVRDLNSGETIKVTSELLSSSELSFLIVNTKVRITYDHLDNGYTLVKRIGLILNDKKQPVRVTADEVKGKNTSSNVGSKSSNQAKGSNQGKNSDAKNSNQDKKTSTNTKQQGQDKKTSTKGSTKKTKNNKGKNTNKTVEKVEESNVSKTTYSDPLEGSENWWAEITEDGRREREARGEQPPTISVGGGESPSNGTKKDTNKIVIDEGNLGDVGLDLVGKILKEKLTTGVRTGLGKKLQQVGKYLRETGEKLQ